MDQVTTGWVTKLPPPGWFRHPIKRFRDSARFLFGRSSNIHYVRLFPNPGFQFTILGRVITYSVHRGLSIKKVR